MFYLSLQKIPGLSKPGDECYPKARRNGGKAELARRKNCGNMKSVYCSGSHTKHWIMFYIV